MSDNSLPQAFRRTKNVGEDITKEGKPLGKSLPTVKVQLNKVRKVKIRLNK